MYHRLRCRLRHIAHHPTRVASFATPPCFAYATVASPSDATASTAAATLPTGSVPINSVRVRLVGRALALPNPSPRLSPYDAARILSHDITLRIATDSRLAAEQFVEKQLVEK